jgi:hypothetical protein
MVAILLKPCASKKWLHLLDEVTSVDTQTNTILQWTIKMEFNNCVMIKHCTPNS